MHISFIDSLRTCCTHMLACAQSHYDELNAVVLTVAQGRSVRVARRNAANSCRNIVTSSSSSALQGQVHGSATQTVCGCTRSTTSCSSHGVCCSAICACSYHCGVSQPMRRFTKLRCTLIYTAQSTCAALRSRLYRGQVESQGGTHAQMHTCWAVRIALKLSASQRFSHASECV